MKIDKENSNDLLEPFEMFNGIKPQNMYVAFIDLLGFSSHVLNDYEETLETYQTMLSSAKLLNVLKGDVKIQIYSDAFLFTSRELLHLVRILNSLQMLILSSGFLCRGGIGFGQHIEVNDDSNYYVISQALVNAVQVEKTIKHPCIAFHESVKIPPIIWDNEAPNLLRTILHYDNINLVSPMSIVWGSTAIDMTKRLLKEFPEHKDKYSWYLGLCEAIFAKEPLVPDKYL